MIAPIASGHRTVPPPAKNSPSHRPERVAELARRLVELRRERGLSQDALGELVGASQATVSRWEDPGSPSCPSALEAATIAQHFEVSADWLVGLQEHRDALPAGAALVDQALLEAFARAASAQELDSLLEQDMSFGTLWVQIPAGAEVVPLQEALRRVKEIDRSLRDQHPELWRRWAEIVLR